jgi:hypothetical protein
MRIPAATSPSLEEPGSKKPGVVLARSHRSSRISFSLALYGREQGNGGTQLGSSRQETTWSRQGANSAARFFSAMRRRSSTVTAWSLQRAVVVPARTFLLVRYWKRTQRSRNWQYRLLRCGGRGILAIFSHASDNVSRQISAQDLRSIRLETAFELLDLPRTLPFRWHRSFPDPHHPNG